MNVELVKNADGVQTRTNVGDAVEIIVKASKFIRNKHGIKLAWQRRNKVFHTVVISIADSVFEDNTEAGLYSGIRAGLVHCQIRAKLSIT